MQYALLIYGTAEGQRRPLDDDVAEVLARPAVSGWARLHGDESATTVRGGTGHTLLTDGPFVESKEFLAGIVLVEADNLDEALAIARDLQETRTTCGIEVRPVRDGRFHAA